MAATKQASGDTIGRYRLEEHLGGGGFGSVWRATDTETGDSVALKLLVAVEAAETRAEIELLAATASSSSEHVVRVLGGDIEPVPYIVMEYVDGSDLAESLTERGRLPIGEVVAVGTALADALVALERVGIIHRDLKPGNVLMDKSGAIKLADFGIAKIAGFATVTSTRQAPMTMAYAAPEVWDGKATFASDLYALGCVLYQCLTGIPPFSGGVGELYKAHAERSPDLSTLPLNTPASLRELIRQCLEKDQAARPANAGQALAMMRRASIEVDDLANAATTGNEPRKFGPWLRRETFPARPWSWWCEHEATGIRAIVELHGFTTQDGGDVIRRAFEANGKLTAHGAERLLGYNRLLLRPGEAWLSDPPGEFLFWVARELPETSDSKLLFSRDELAKFAVTLAAMRDSAERVGLPLELSDRTLVLAEGGVRVLRPGLPPVDLSDNDVAAVGWLARLAVDADSSELIRREDGLAAVAAALNAPADVGVASPWRSGPTETDDHDDSRSEIFVRGEMDQSSKSQSGPPVTLQSKPAPEPAKPRPLPHHGRRSVQLLALVAIVALTTIVISTLGFLFVDGGARLDRQPAGSDGDGSVGLNLSEPTRGPDPGGGGSLIVPHEATPTATFTPTAISSATVAFSREVTPVSTTLPPTPTRTPTPTPTWTPTRTPSPTSTWTPTPTRTPSPTPTWTPTPTPTQAYSLTISMDGTQFAPGEPTNVTYRLHPVTPFTINWWRSVNGGPFQLVASYIDDGTGDTIPATAGEPGSRVWRFEAWVDGQLKDTVTVYGCISQGGTSVYSFAGSVSCQ
ncbi:MAG: hypothetical protein AMXMBFR80_09330 [Dehalococcoidia bacterium]